MPRLNIKVMVTGLLAGALLLAGGSVWADDFSYTVTAHVDPAQGVAIQAYSADPASPDVLNPVVGEVLNFGTLDYNEDAEIFLPNVFFVIDVSAIDGAGAPDVTVTYTENDAGNPNSIVGGNGLGHKGTATFTKVTFGAEPEDTVVSGLAAHGPKKLLVDVNENIDELELVPGILRIFLGIVSFDPDATFPDPASGEPFTVGDQPGDYFGTLFVSATVD